jgi:hypothetical protein
MSSPPPARGPPPADDQQNDVWSRVSDGSSPAISSYELNYKASNQTKNSPLGDYQQDIIVNDLPATEQFMVKLKRKCKEDPLVPVGM